MSRKRKTFLLMSLGLSIIFCGCGNKSTEGTSKKVVIDDTVIQTEAQSEKTTEKKLSTEDEFKSKLKWIIEPQADYVNVEPLVDVMPLTAGFNNESIVTTDTGQMLVGNATGKVYVDTSEKFSIVNSKVCVLDDYKVINAKGERINYMPNSGHTTYYSLSDNKVHASEMGGMSKTDADYYIFRNIVGDIDLYKHTVLDTYTLYNGRTNSRVTDKTYDSARTASDLKMPGDCFVVRSEGLWGFINTKGEKITDFIYEDAYIMNNGIAAVKKDGKAGYIDSTGKELCPFIFDETRTIQNNVAWVKYNGNWGILDAGIFTGNEPDIEAITASIEK